MTSEMSERRMLLSGIYVMGAVGFASAIWPSVAAVVSGVFVAVLGVAVLVPAGLALRWAPGPPAWRRELPKTAAAEPGHVLAPEPIAAALEQLREPA